MSEQIDLSRFTGMSENEEVSRQKDPRRETGPPLEKQRPDYHRRTLERDGLSEWSGGSMGGGVWAGRSR